MFGIAAFSQVPFDALIADFAINISGVNASGNVGTVTRGETQLALTGVGADGAIGGGQFYSVVLSGVSASGAVGIVRARSWQLIDDTQSANWQNIATPQSAGWAVIDSSEPTTWTLIESVN